MIRKSIQLLSSTGTNWEITGNSIPGNSYYGYSAGIHTVQVIYQNFVGGFGIQGTLSLNPTDTDWFWIQLNSASNTGTPYITFPINILAPTGKNGGDTGSAAFTFVGNFVYLRAMLVRSYIGPAPTEPAWQNWVHGQIDTALLSM